jgi:hypothetical protein
MKNKHVICVGAACWDTVFQVEQIPAAGVKALALHAVQRAAGMAVNAAVALIFAATFISLLLGLPLGIWVAKSNRMAAIIRPTLDFMQTMPAAKQVYRSHFRESTHNAWAQREGKKQQSLSQNGYGDLGGPASPGNL